jgi:hypothetical protein
MGWSCRKEASETMGRWTAACVAQTGSSNVYLMDGREYFWELSQKEHDDGAITGAIVEVVEKRLDGSSTAKSAGTFRINPDGSVARAPAFLKGL